ncbi:hypothetical protein B4U84_30285, partial [Westiellopsis prolifica IICB1]
KKFGVCRTVVTPSPEDSLILQCLVESLITKLLKNQPTSNAFFSRSHQTPEKNSLLQKIIYGLLSGRNLQSSELKSHQAIILLQQLT